MHSNNHSNDKIAVLRDRLDQAVAQIVRKEDGELDFSNVTVYGDVAPEVKAASFVEDQRRFSELMEQQKTVNNAVVAFEEFRASNPARQVKGVPMVITSQSQNSLVKRIVESKAMREWQSGITSEIPFEPVELKALFSTGSGYPPEALRSGVVAETPVRPLRVIDLLPMSRTQQNAWKFMSQTTRTNAAAEVAEGNAAPEATLAFAEVTEPIRRISVALPVTEEQLTDEVGIEDLVRTQLIGMIRERLDSQILNGNGTAPNLRGILNVSGIQTQAQGTDTPLDALYKAITKVRTGGYAVPSAIIINPTNLQAIKLAKTTDGVYLMGSPSERGAPTIWGYPIVETDAIPVGKALVGAFDSYAALVMRTGLEFRVGEVNDQFVRSQTTMLATIRCAVAVYRPTAFCEVTFA